MDPAAPVGLLYAGCCGAVVDGGEGEYAADPLPYPADTAAAAAAVMYPPKSGGI